MDWGTRVSVGGGWKRPQAAPSPGGESGAAQHPRAAASPRHAERESQSQSTNCTPAPDSPPAHGHSNRNRNSNGSPPPSAVGRGKMGRAKTLHPGRLGLATPLLRSAAEAGRAGPAAVGCTARQRARELPGGLGAVRTRPFLPRTNRLSDTSLPRSLTGPQILPRAGAGFEPNGLSPGGVHRHLPLTPSSTRLSRGVEAPR